MEPAYEQSMRSKLKPSVYQANSVNKSERAEFVRTDVQSVLSKRKVSESNEAYNRTKNNTSYLNTEPQPTHRR